MCLTLEHITEKNREEIGALKTFSYQKDLCESVEECLKDFEKYKNYVPVGIKKDLDFIGFAMYGFFVNEGGKGRAWLDRIFIDLKFQNQGLGKKSLLYLINEIKDIYSVDEIYLSVFSNNAIAIHLYLELGFEFNGEKDCNGEDIMVLKLSK